MGKEDYKNEKKGHGFLCVPKELLFDNRYKQLTIEVILSILVDTFLSRISLTMLPAPNLHNTSCVLS